MNSAGNLALKLLTPSQAAKRLSICERTLRGHVKARRIMAINVGAGEKRHTLRFDPVDIDAFVQARKGALPCQSISRNYRHTTNTTSTCEVIAFTELQAQRKSGKLSK